MRDYRNKGKWNDIQLHLTNYCNHRCKHCYTNSNQYDKQWLDIKIVKELIPFLNENERRVVRLLGGEIITPKNEITKYLNVLKENKIKPIICSNGYYFNQIENVISKFYFSEVIISLYGLKEQHEYITQIENSFDNALRSIKLLTSNKLNVDYVTVNTSITNQNIYEFQEFIYFLKTLDVDEVKILTISPIGRCDRGTYNNISVESINLEISISDISELARKVFPMKIVYEPMTNSEKCRIEKHTMISIDHLGHVYPCHLLIGNYNYVIGNLHDSRITEIIEDIEGYIKLNLIDNNCLAYKRISEIIRDKGKNIFGCPLYLELLENG